MKQLGGTHLWRRFKMHTASEINYTILYLLASLSGFSFSLLIHVQYSYGFFSPAIVFDMIAVVIVLVTTVAVVVGKCHRRIKYLVLQLIVACLFGFLVASRVNSSKSKLSKQEAKQIISALEQFHARYEKYPESLQELVPEYLESIPTTRMRFWNHIRFRYFLYEDSYQLRFVGPYFTMLEYRKNFGWSTHD